MPKKDLKFRLKKLLPGSRLRNQWTKFFGWCRPLFSRTIRQYPFETPNTTSTPISTGPLCRRVFESSNNASRFQTPDVEGFNIERLSISATYTDRFVDSLLQSADMKYARISNNLSKCIGNIASVLLNSWKTICQQIV